MDIAIFGAGVAGLMSAITLRARGHRCHIHERSPQALDAGMGFILVAEAIRCLQSFGVQLTGPLSGMPLERYLCRDCTGRIVHEQTIPAGARGILRRDLIAALIRALGDDSPQVLAGLDTLEFDAHSDVVAAQLTANGGNTRITADLFVSAEGVNSRARQLLFPDWPTTPDPVPEMVGLVRSAEAVRWAGRALNKFHADDGGIAFGILPVGPEHVVWYLQFDSQRYPLPAEPMRNGNGAALARGRFVERLVGGWADPIPSLLAASDFAAVHLWRPIETGLIPQFHRGNLVLVGDAAHPLSPFTSQGVASALSDAVALAEAVDAAAHGKATLEEALNRYSTERHAQCAPLLAKGLELTREFLAPMVAQRLLLPIA